MPNYDGPSFYRRNHPEIKPYNNYSPAKEEKSAKQKASWPDRANQFKNTHEELLPKNVRIRADLQREAMDYMNTPPAASDHAGDHFTQRKSTQSQIPQRRSYFKNKYIPQSLQQLDGWKKTGYNYELIYEIEKRLEKQPDSYLLFEEFIADELKDRFKVEESKAALNPQPETTAPKEELSDKPKTRNHQRVIDSKTKKKVKRVQAELKSNLSRPNTGLHRSLSNIMAEDQKALDNMKKNLGSLFTNEEKD